VDQRTARVTTNRRDEDSLRAAISSSLSLAHGQPKDPGLLAMPGRQRYRAVRRACDLAIKTGQVAAGIFATGQSRLAMGNSRGRYATYTQTRAEFSITMQEGSAASWAKANSPDVRAFDPLKLAARACEKAHRAVNPAEIAPGR